MTTPYPTPQPMSAATAERHHKAGALLLDVRPQIARHQGSITDATVVDVKALAKGFNPRSTQPFPGLSPDSEIVVCSVSSRRALPAAEYLARVGYRNVYYLDGGYAAWHNRHNQH